MKTASKKLNSTSKSSDRELLDDPDQLLAAIMKAVGALQPGEQLEIRRVKLAKRPGLSRPKKKAVARKPVKSVGRRKMKVAK